MTDRRPTGVRVKITPRLKKQMRWAAPVDGRGVFDHVLFPEFPVGVSAETQARSERIVRALPSSDDLELLKSQLECLQRRIEAGQVNRLIDMRFHAVQCLENSFRYDLLEELDPIE